MENKLSLIDTPISEKQVLAIFQRTPRKHIFKRPAKGGGTWEYCTGTYIRKVLNYTFGFLWSFEVKEIEEKYKQISVLGRLTIMNQDTLQPMIWKEQVGRADIKYKKGTEIPVDYGNDKKAAITDALKKCASELGIASDIYGKNEFREIKIEEVEEKSDKLFSETKELISKVKDKGQQKQAIENVLNSKQFNSEEEEELKKIGESL
jgi:recombination DNA repair RAD52 pathway protein